MSVHLCCTVYLLLAGMESQLDRYYLLLQLARVRAHVREAGVQEKDQPAMKDDAPKKPILPHQQSIEMMGVHETEHGIVRSTSRPGSFKGVC